MAAEELIAGAALRVFGTRAYALKSSSEWNDLALWRSAYDGLADGPEFLAENFLGEQYRSIGGRIVRWNIETAESEPTGLSWAEWLETARRDPATLVPIWLLQDWEIQNRVLEPHEHLAPKRPFVLGGEFQAANLYAVESVSNLRWNAQLACGLRDVPDGEEVRISLRWV